MKSALALLLAFTLLLAGCVDDNDAPEDNTDGGDEIDHSQHDMEDHSQHLAPTVRNVKLAGAYPVTIAYDPAEIKVPSGRNVTLTFTNTDQNVLAPHDWVLEGVDGAATDVLDNGQSQEISFPAPAPGTYAFFCSVQGHRDAGMEGTFIVEEATA